MPPDPRFTIGDSVQFQGRHAVVEYLYFGTAEQAPYRFIGYQLRFEDGTFSGWHPEDQIVGIVPENADRPAPDTTQ